MISHEPAWNKNNTSIKKDITIWNKNTSHWFFRVTSQLGQWPLMNHHPTETRHYITANSTAHWPLSQPKTHSHNQNNFPPKRKKKKSEFQVPPKTFLVFVLDVFSSDIVMSQLKWTQQLDRYFSVFSRFPYCFLRDLLKRIRFLEQKKKILSA